MELDARRFIVVGATGALGGRLAHALAQDGARVALAGRDAGRLAEVVRALGGDMPSATLDLERPAEAATVVEALADDLGGLDGVIVASGAVAFGRGAETSDEIAARLLTVNALGPMAVVRAALPRLADPSVVVALSAIVADHPTAGMAAYSASKAALSAYLTALRREVRRDGVTVLDVRPPHLETAFADRALAGVPPKLPPGADPDALVDAVLAAIREDRRTLTYDLKARALVAA